MGASGYRFAAASRRRAGCCEMNPLRASRTTSASDRRSEKAIARSASCCSASIAAKSVTGSESFLSPARAPRRGTPALVARSVFIANLLFADAQVLDRTHKFQIDGLLPEPFPQHVARVGSQPVARLRRVGHIHLDQCQHVPIDNALIPPEPSRRVVAENEERAAAEAAGGVVLPVPKTCIPHPSAI